MLALVLLAIGVVFVGYAVATRYTQTPADQSVPKRIWAAVVAAGGALGAALASWLHNVTAP